MSIGIHEIPFNSCTGYSSTTSSCMQQEYGRHGASTTGRPVGETAAQQTYQLSSISLAWHSAEQVTCTSRSSRNGETPAATAPGPSSNFGWHATPGTITSQAAASVSPQQILPETIMIADHEDSRHYPIIESRLVLRSSRLLSPCVHARINLRRARAAWVWILNGGRFAEADVSRVGAPLRCNSEPTTERREVIPKDASRE